MSARKNRFIKYKIIDPDKLSILSLLITYVFLSSVFYAYVYAVNVDSYFSTNISSWSPASYEWYYSTNIRARGRFELNTTTVNGQNVSVGCLKPTRSFFNRCTPDYLCKFFFP